MATVHLTPEAAEELESLNNPMHARVLRLLVRLEQWPDVSGAKALTGDLAGHYRLRTGDYRVQFRVADDKVTDDKVTDDKVTDDKVTVDKVTVEKVTVEKIGHRDGFYEE